MRSEVKIQFRQLTVSTSYLMNVFYEEVGPSVFELLPLDRVGEVDRLMRRRTLLTDAPLNIIQTMTQLDNMDLTYIYKHTMYHTSSFLCL